MFDFRTIAEVVTDPRDMGLASLKPDQNGPHVPKPQIKNRKFVEITRDTPLSVLNRFFEWNSAAIVTDRDETETLRPVAVITKVDLLTWMLQHSKNGGSQ
jgi:cystathionine beta-synthase